MTATILLSSVTDAQGCYGVMPGGSNLEDCRMEDLGCDDNGMGEEMSGSDLQSSERTALGDGNIEDNRRRAQALQEKNRKAQRRFRERQKARVAELETQVEELQAQIAAVETQKHETVTQNIKLMRIMLERDEELEKLKAALHQAQTAAPTCSSPRSPDDAEDELTITLEGGQTVVTTAEVKALTLQQLVNIWRIYVKQLAQCLHKVGDDATGDQQALADAQRLAGEACDLQMRVALCNPVMIKEFVACKMEDSAGPDAENRELWLEVARRLGLDKTQRQAICELRTIFLGKLQSILLERKALHAAIVDSLPQFINARHTAVQYLKAQDGLDRLKENLNLEHLLLLNFISTMYNNVLSRLQLARCFVQSYPWAPDTLAIATWVAVDAGDLTAICMLSSGASGGLPDAVDEEPHQHSLEGLEPCSVQPWVHTPAVSLFRNSSCISSSTRATFDSEPRISGLMKSSGSYGGDIPSFAFEPLADVKSEDPSPPPTQHGRGLAHSSSFHHDNHTGPCWMA